MTIEFKSPLTIYNIEMELGEILKQGSLPILTNDALEELWKKFKSSYQYQAVPNALIFFTANMPPLKPDGTYERMVGAALKEDAFDILYNETELNTIFKILSSDIDPAYKEKYFSILFKKADIATRLQTENIGDAIIRAWVKIRNESYALSKIEFLYTILRENKKKPWIPDPAKLFLETQKIVFIDQIPNYIKKLMSKMPFNFSGQLLRLARQETEEAELLFWELGSMLNDDNIPIDKRFEFFKGIFDAYFIYADNGGRKYSKVYSDLFIFIQKNWNNDLLKNFFEKNERNQIDFLMISKLSELDWNENYDPLFTIIQDPNYQQMLKNMSPKLRDLYDEMKMKLNLFDLRKNIDSEPNILETKLNNALGGLHKNNLTTFSQMIFPENIINEPRVGEPPLAIKEIFYNQKGYDRDITFPEGDIYKTGNPLTLEDGTPIGYNIHLPLEAPKGVFVRVYGGYERYDRENRMYRPGLLASVEKDLLNRGIAVVSLNLADLIELRVNQSQLPKKLEDKIQASIHQFYETIKYHPDKLHPNLQLPPNIPFCLYGQSFGGRTAIKHAQKYPNTYDRIISFDGALSHEMGQKSDLPIVNRISNEKTLKAQKYLDAIHDIEKMNENDDILLLHNMDDNNVNIKVTLDWYKKAKKAGKQNKVRLYITEKGSPIPSGGSPVGTAHHPTEGEISFNNMMDVIFNHIQQGSSSLPALTEWRSLRYNILADKNYKSANIEQKFISLAYRLKKQKYWVEVDSKEQAAQLNELYYMLNYLKRLPTDVQRQDIIALQEANLLTDEAITNALETYLEQFIYFLKEKEWIPIPDKINIATLAKNQELRDQFRDILINPSSNEFAFHFALLSLYQKNPQLLKSHSDKCQKDPMIQNNLKNALKKLDEKIAKEEVLIPKVWQQTIKEVQKRIRLTWKEKDDPQQTTQQQIIDPSQEPREPNKLKPTKK